MNHADLFIALLMLILIGIILYCVWRGKKGRIPYVRPISGIAAMEEAVGRSTEMGKPIFFIPGNADIQSIDTHNTMAVLSHITKLAARMRTQLVVLIQVPNVFPLVEDTMRQAYISEGSPELFQPQEQVIYLSSDGVVFAAGVARMVEEQTPGCVIFFGSHDFTSLLLAEPGARLGILQIAADPSLFQVPFFVCTCDHTIIGEEFYAAGAYVSPDPKMRNILLSQDLIKILFVALIIIGFLIVNLLPLKDSSGQKKTISGWIVEQLTKYK